jgi:hypothetical protein
MGPGSRPGRRSECGDVIHPTPNPSPGRAREALLLVSCSAPVRDGAGSRQAGLAFIVRAARRLPARGDIMASPRLLSNMARLPCLFRPQPWLKAAPFPRPPAWSHRRTSSRGPAPCRQQRRGALADQAAGQRLSGCGLHVRTLGLRITANRRVERKPPGAGSLHPPRRQPSSLNASAIPRGIYPGTAIPPPTLARRSRAPCPSSEERRGQYTAVAGTGDGI